MSKFKLLSVICVVVYHRCNVSLSVFSPCIGENPGTRSPNSRAGKDDRHRTAQRMAQTTRLVRQPDTEVIRDAYKTAEAFEAYIEVMRKKARRRLSFGSCYQ
jgi:hypothetical protein